MICSRNLTQRVGKALIRQNFRPFFRDLGIADCNETDVLIAIKDGIYKRQEYVDHVLNEDPNKEIDPVKFQKGELIIYDYERQLPDLRINPVIPFFTVGAMYMLFQAHWKGMFTESYFVRPVLTMMAVNGAYKLINRTIERRKCISRIELLQHPDNERYAGQIRITRPDGHQFTIPIKDIKSTINDEHQMLVDVQEEGQESPTRYCLRFNNLPEVPDFTSDLLYATLFEKTGAVFIEKRVTKKKQVSYAKMPVNQVDEESQQSETK